MPALKNLKSLKYPSFRRGNQPKRPLRIPKEKEIKRKFLTKIPLDIESMENPDSTIHVLEKPWAGIRMLEQKCQSLQNEINKSQQDSRKTISETKQIISTLKNNESELDGILEHGINELRHYWGLMRIDSLDHQNKKVSMHKQVQKLKRSELELIVSTLILLTYPNSYSIG